MACGHLTYPHECRDFCDLFDYQGQGHFIQVLPVCKCMHQTAPFSAKSLQTISSFFSDDWYITDEFMGWLKINRGSGVSVIHICQKKKVIYSGNMYLVTSLFYITKNCKCQ